MRRQQRVPRIGAGTLLSLFTADAVLAQSSATPAAPSVGAGAFVGLMQVVVALVVVLALIAAFAWLMRRMTQGRHLGGELVKVRGGVMLGPKERAVLLEVADTWIVVGVGGGQVNALHAMPRPPESGLPQAPAADARSFSTWLQQTLRDKTAVSK